VLVTPGGGTTAARAAALPSGSHDLTPWRAPVDEAEAERPLEIDGTSTTSRVEEYVLPNGLAVQLAPDPDSPVVDARLVFPVGSAHEPSDRPYLATAAAKLLSIDLEGFYELAMIEKLEWSLSRGTQYDVDVDETATTFRARGLSQWGDWHVWYLSWLLDQGRYNAVSLEAVHDAARARGHDEDDEYDPRVKLFLERLYGAGHPYAQPPPRRGAAYLSIDADDLDGWRAKHYRARGATRIVSGGFDVDAMKREIDELFGPWSGDAPAPLPVVSPFRPAKGPTWIAVDAERLPQTIMLLGFAMPPRRGESEAARYVLAEMIRDALRDVREGMGASYGLGVGYESSAAGNVLRVFGEVDETKADAVLVRVLASLEAIRAGGDDQRAAFVRARKKVLAQALGRTGGASAVAGELAGNAAAGHSLRHGSILATQISSLRMADVAEVAAHDLAPERRVVLVAGKRTSVDAAFAAISVTPERPLPLDKPDDEDDAADKAAARPKPAARPKGAPKPHRREDGPQLSVGRPAGDIASTETGLFLGDRKLTVDEFLWIAGEDELLSAMKKRRWVKRGMRAAGVVGVLGSVAIVLTGPECDMDIMRLREYEECTRAVSRRKVKAVAVLASGAILAALSIEIGSGKPSEEQLRRFAARYNRVVVTPEVHDKGAGLVLSGRF
jgi:predicted Zn-dependent peptidase